MKIIPKAPLADLQKYFRGMEDTKKTTPHARDEGLMKEVQDRVQLSDHAIQLSGAKKMLSQISEIRASKVYEISKEIKEGSYQINGEMIASNLLKDMLENAFFVQD